MSEIVKPGKCLHCGKRRPIPKTLVYAKPVDFEVDEFCSRVCCEAFHGITHPYSPGIYGMYYRKKAAV